MVTPMVVPRVMEMVMAEAEGSLGEEEMLTRARINPKGLTLVGAGIVGRLATEEINGLSILNLSPRIGDRNPKNPQLGMV